MRCDYHEEVFWALCTQTVWYCFKIYSEFFMLLVHYQQVFMRLVSAFRRRRRRLRLNRAGFRNRPWSKSPSSLRPAESWFEVGTVLRFLFFLPIFWLKLSPLLLASIILMEGAVLVEADCSPICRQWPSPLPWYESDKRIKAPLKFLVSLKMKTEGQIDKEILSTHVLRTIIAK